MWTKDSPNPTSTVGSSVVVAAYAGGAWGTPVEIADATHFNNAPALAHLTATQPLVVWERASGSGISLSSTITDVLTALGAIDIYYNARVGGVWNAPAALAALVGSDLAPQVAADGQGAAFVAWMNTADAANTALYTVFWNGLGWAAPTPLAHPAGIVDSLTAGYIVSGTESLPVLVWAQATDNDDANRDDLMLFYSRYHGGQWSAPRMVAGTVPPLRFAPAVCPASEPITAWPAPPFSNYLTLFKWPTPPVACGEFQSLQHLIMWKTSLSPRA